ncbi:unnamed protein product [Cochlearia groenlandica]
MLGTSQTVRHFSLNHRYKVLLLIKQPRLLSLPLTIALVKLLRFGRSQNSGTDGVSSNVPDLQDKGNAREPVQLSITGSKTGYYSVITALPFMAPPSHHI